MYVAPDRSYTAIYPSPLRRLGAGAIDWLLAFVIFLLASIVGGVFQAVGAVSWDAGDLRGIPGSLLILFSQLIVAAPVVAYFAYYWTTGSTLGMRALDIELVRDETGHAPGWAVTVLRACLAFVLAFAANTVYLVLARDPLEEYSGVERTVIAASVAFAAAGLAAKLWMLVDERRRSLLDKAFGLVYVEELVFSRAGRWPWSGGVR